MAELIMSKIPPSSSCHEEAREAEKGEFTLPLAAMQTFRKNWLSRKFNKESMTAQERAALHKAKMKYFRSSSNGDPPVDGFDNPLFEELWVPWATRMQYIGVGNPDVVFSDSSMSEFCWTQLAQSYAIPTFRVLQYMVSKAPGGKIAEIGSGTGYWASLLKSLGAHVVAVDNFEWLGKTNCDPMVETVRMDGVEFIKQGGADGHALFLCWPLMKPIPKDIHHPTDEERYCFAEACLDIYKGDTVFFVGESPGCTYDVAEWMEEHSKLGWRRETEIEIPCWKGLHDSFMCFVKHQET